MDVRKIKDLLHAWRPGQDVPHEALEAREIAAKDPALAAWLDSERAFDQAFADRLRDVTPPADLLDRILAAHEKEASNVVPFPRSEPLEAETRRSRILRYAVSIAASLVIVGGVFFFIGRSSSRGADLDSFVNETVVRAVTEHMHQVRGTEDVFSGLRGDHAPVPAALPAELGQFQPVKYGSIATQNGIMSQIGFANDESCRLIVMERRCLGGCSTKLSKPVMFDLGDQLAVAWAKDNQVFILVSDRTDESVIRSIVSREAPASPSF